MPAATADTPTPGAERVLKALFVGTGLASALAALVFAALPAADLAASRVFFGSDKRFIADQVAWVEGVRWAFLVLFWTCVVAAIWGLVAASIEKRNWLGLSARHWLFVAICLGVGPGLVANSLLKDQWGRARPREIVEFGGQRTFTRPLVPTNQCERNCSFVSGEASSAFAPFYTAALAFPQWGLALITAGTVAGLAAGVVRIAQGGHFLSDIIFAGIFMALTIMIVHQIMFAWAWPRSLLGPWRSARR
jgi:lipid A 4'-phosphatase